MARPTARKKPTRDAPRAAAAAAAPLTPIDRWFGKLGMAVLTVLLLSAALAPLGQFYLAWVGLVPLLWLVQRCRSQWRAFGWGWLAGLAFFSANMWWMAYVTAPGTVGLMAYLALYWGLAAVILRGAGLLEFPAKLCRGSLLARVATIAVVWVGLEYLRSIVFTGLPWLFLGHTQSPLLAMCQIADVFGVFGISFWVAAVNAVVFFALRATASPGTPGEGRGGGESNAEHGTLNAEQEQATRSAFRVPPSPSDPHPNPPPGYRERGPNLAAAGVAVALLILLVLAYGLFRRAQTSSATFPGPRVAVVQANYPQDNSGEKGASEEQRLAFHLDQSRQALRAHGPIDLVVWSETMLPELNPEYRQASQGMEITDRKGKVLVPDVGKYLDGIVAQVAELSRQYHANVLAGGTYYGRPQQIGSENYRVLDRRNSAYVFVDGQLTPQRYDKIHLVPFGEYLPFKQTPGLQWLHKFFMNLSPYDFDYTLTAGDAAPVPTFVISAGDTSGIAGGKPMPVRVGAPICFEDLDSSLAAQMVRDGRAPDGIAAPPPGGVPAGKRVDLLVNLTNDGWFKGFENAQHLQASVFRCIENRVPMARSVNTGVSAFIDSYGRVTDALPVRTAGVAVATVRLDRRLTVFSRLGDWFGVACTLASGVVIVLARATPLFRRDAQRSAAR